MPRRPTWRLPVLGILDAAVVAPFAGVVHVGLALLEQLAVAGKRVEPLRADHVDLGALLHVLLAVGPLDRSAPLSRTVPRRRPPAPAIPETARSFPEPASSWINSPACGDNGCRDDRPSELLPRTATNQAVFDSRSTSSQAAIVGTSNHAPAEISVIGMRIPAGTGAAAGDHGAGRRSASACRRMPGNPDCIGMARRIALPGEKEAPGRNCVLLPVNREEIHRCRRLTTS